MVVKQFSNGIHQEIGNEDTFDVIPGKDMALKLNNVTDTDATRFRCTFLSSFAAPKSIIEVEIEGEFLPFVDLLTLLHRYIVRCHQPSARRSVAPREDDPLLVRHLTSRVDISSE